MTCPEKKDCRREKKGENVYVTRYKKYATLYK
jgi:hypothetical protein